MKELPQESYPPLPLLTQLKLDTSHSDNSPIPTEVLLQLLLHPPNLRSLTFLRESLCSLLQLMGSTSLYSPGSIIHTLQELHLPFNSYYLSANSLVRILDNYRNVKVLTIPFDSLAQKMLLYWKDHYSTHSHNITTLNIHGDFPKSKVNVDLDVVTTYDMEVVLPTLQDLCFHNTIRIYSPHSITIDARTNQLKNITFDG